MLVPRLRTHFGRLGFHVAAPVIWISDAAALCLHQSWISEIGLKATSSYKPTHDPLRTLVFVSVFVVSYSAFVRALCVLDTCNSNKYLCSKLLSSSSFVTWCVYTDFFTARSNSGRSINYKISVCPSVRPYVTHPYYVKRTNTWRCRLN